MTERTDMTTESKPAEWDYTWKLTRTDQDATSAAYWKAQAEANAKDARHLRRLLAVRVAMPGTYFDDGEASGQQHGISIDFMREPVADIDAKLRALNVARVECAAIDAAMTAKDRAAKENP